MKKIILFIIVFFHLASLPAVEKNVDFYMYFNKTGETKLYVYELGSPGVEASRIAFTPDWSESVKEYTAKFGVHAETYDAVNPRVVLMFTDKYVIDDVAGHMLTSDTKQWGETDSSFPVLNYDVEAREGETTIATIDNSGKNRNEINLPIENRRITLYGPDNIESDESDSNKISINKDYEVFLTLTPPLVEGGEAYSYGTYTGYIVLSLYSN